MRRVFSALAVLACLAPGSPAHAEVRLTMSNGRVSLHASNATVRQILDEWARVGQTRILNADKIPGGLVTLDLDNVSEVDALEIVLRSAAGYLAAPRATPAANLSRYDRIVVVATSAPSAPGAAPVRDANDAAMRRPGFAGRPPFAVGGPPETNRPGGDQADDGAPITNVTLPNRGAVFNNFQQPQTIETNDPNMPEPGAPGRQQQALPPGQLIPNPPVPSAPPPGTAVVPSGTATPGVIIQPQPTQQGR